MRPITKQSKITGYRVTDKVLGIDKTFSLSKKVEAESLAADIRKKRKPLRLIAELFINRLFSISHENGTEIVKVRGLKRVVRHRATSISDYPAYQYTLDGKQEKLYSTIFKGRAFEYAWEEMRQKICSAHGLDSSLELNQLFKRAKRNYWNAPSPTKERISAPVDSPGGELKALRVTAGLTQGAVAETIGVSIASVSHWEKNTFMPSDTNLSGLKTLFGVQKFLWIK